VQKIKNCTLNATNVGVSNARPIAEDEASELANKKDRYKWGSLQICGKIPTVENFATKKQC